MTSSNVQASVATLLDKYSLYKKTKADLDDISSVVAKLRLKKVPHEGLRRQYERLVSKLQTISDSMLFDSPRIWILYKYEAYASESEPIRNLRDFRAHCSKPGHVCTKRYEFLNTELARRGFRPLSDQRTYSDGMELISAASTPELVKLCGDEDFIDKWHSFEHYKDRHRVAKWENYITLQ